VAEWGSEAMVALVNLFLVDLTLAELVDPKLILFDFAMIPV
jgi:hypothetical protein